MNDFIYLDNNATTKIDPRVQSVIFEELIQSPANPSSMHTLGLNACERLDNARKQIAMYLKVKPEEIIFTSGGTETMNMLIKGIFMGRPKGQIITSSVEHVAVLNTVNAMRLDGCEPIIINPGLQGSVSPEEVFKAINTHTKLITLMAVNNETGAKTNIKEIARIAKAHQIPFIVDGVALLGKEVIEIPDGVTAMGFSGHKCHAPTGIGFAYVQAELALTPMLSGGAQEFGRRAGTQNLSGIAGLAKAISILHEHQTMFSKHMETLRDRLETGIKEMGANVRILGQGPRVVNTTCIAFPEINREEFFTKLNQAGIMVSSGSACFSHVVQPSRILLNMGIEEKIAQTALRFSLSRMNTTAEIEHVIDVIAAILNKKALAV